MGIALRSQSYTCLLQNTVLYLLYRVPYSPRCQRRLEAIYFNLAFFSFSCVNRASETGAAARAMLLRGKEEGIGLI